jgi:hypothetical protein
MGIEKQIDDKSAAPTQGNVELGCSLVFTALYWPFMSCALVTFHVLLGVPKEPFDATLVWVPSMLVATSASQLAIQLLSREEQNNFRAVFRQAIKVVPFILVMVFINYLAGFILRFFWSTANRYAFILFGSFAAGAVCTACTYVFWRLLVYPILNPFPSKKPYPTK